MHKRVLIIDSSLPYEMMFLNKGWELVKHIEEADLLQFTGGEDVSANLYNEAKHPKTYNSLFRDEVEKEWYNEGIKKGIPMAGVCRGGQFLNVCCGGAMYQHVSNHTTDHSITVLDGGQTVWATSTHHQMFRPSEEAKWLAIARCGGVREHMLNTKDISSRIAIATEHDPEVIMYEKQKCLCFQPHPEFMSGHLDGLRNYYFECITKLMELK